MTANRINKDHVKKSIIVRESNKRIKNNNQYAVIMKLGFVFVCFIPPVDFRNICFDACIGNQDC